MSPLPITGMQVSAALSEAFNLTGKLPLQLDETVVPVVTVADLADSIWGPTAVGTVNVPAAVGFRSEVEISLPQIGSASGAALIVDKITVVGEAAATKLISIGASPGLAYTIAGFTDWSDNGQIGAPSALLVGKNTAVATAGFNNTLVYAIEAGRDRDIPLAWICRAFAPTGLQQGLMIRPYSSNNQTVRLNVHWRERLPR